MRVRCILAFVAVCVAWVSSGWGRDQGAFTYEAWRAEVAGKGLNPDEVVYPFHASPEMVAWAEDATDAVSRSEPRRRLTQLQRAFFDTKGDGFVYDDSRNLTAADAFQTRRGNCMSFTALFIAMSRSLGIETALLEVQREPEIDRQDSLVVVNRHVAAAYSSGPQMAIFDFYLNSDAPVTGRKVIDDVFASAIHHNNLGGVALRENRLGDALKNLEIATILAPTWPPGWVNLGVARVHNDDVGGALAAYGRALDADPRNSSALNNLSILYGRLGRYNEAWLALTAAARRGRSPFVLVALADSEMLAGRMDEAGKYLRRAKRLDPDEPEVWDALARLARRTGQDRREAKCRKKADTLRLAAADAR